MSLALGNLQLIQQVIVPSFLVVSSFFLLCYIAFSYHVGRTMFETDRLPANWVDKMNKMDEIWVPSLFMKSIFVRQGVKNVRVVGESVDTDFFRPIPSVHSNSSLSVLDDQSNTLNMSRAYLFDKVFERHPLYGYGVQVLFSMFKWEFRKGWDILLDVYFHTFSKKDTVSLFIVTQEYHAERKVESYKSSRIYRRSSA